MVVTTLNNYAMPLLRYVIRDYAQVGEPCSCGRGLPVLARIMGRERNMLTLPDGRRHWPSFPAECWTGIAPIRQLQLIQRDLDTIEACLVVEQPLSAAQEQRLTAMLHERFGHPFAIRFSYPKRIERQPGHKYEDFVSEVSP